MKDNEETLNEKYADILELLAERLRSLKYNVSQGTMNNIEKISQDIIEQGKDEIELEKLEQEGKPVDSKNNLVRRILLEENIEKIKLKDDGISEEEMDELIESMKNEKDSEFHAIDKETLDYFDNYINAFAENIEDVEKANNIGTIEK